MLSGMLNMDAYAYGFTTENSHYGATHNPHDLNRIAGDLLADLRQRSPQGSCTFLSAVILTVRSGFPPHCVVFWAETNLWPPVTPRHPPICRQSGPYRPNGTLYARFGGGL